MIFEVIALRNALMIELNAGFYDSTSWDALYIMARDAGCDAIADQVEGYIKHYSQEEN